MNIQNQAIRTFVERYGFEPQYLIRAPGRVNLIGEHTDYNDGFVFPMAINRAIWIALQPSNESAVQLYSKDFSEEFVMNINEIKHSAMPWGEYVAGMAWALTEHGLGLSGWRGVVAGDIPIGAGLSSSAAMELAVARAFSLAAGFEWKPLEVAKIAQFSENQWVGVNCGIMDQTIVAAGEEGHALMIDCRNLELQSVPLPAGTVVVILDTNTRRGLIDSAYNERRAQCEAAAAFFEVAALRDVSPEMFESHKEELEPTTRKRSKHIIYENQRVLDAVDALRRGDAESFGRLMNESHVSMRDDFEISRREMDIMVAFAQSEAGCLGARMTGGGFGGCAIALVDEGHAERFSYVVGNKYEEQTGIKAEIYITGAENGVRIVEL
ncbi:MAG: galactokinase [Anaerolineales bacterium]